MDEKKLLNDQVQRWRADGRWVDRGRWKPANNGLLEYVPTKREIAAKCRLFRSIARWRGANKRAPRAGKYAVATMAGV